MPHYMPLLKAKAGEFTAISHLSARTRAGLLPLIDIPKVDMDWDENRPRKTLEAHLHAKAKRISQAWGPSQPIIVDLFDIVLDERTSDGEHPVPYIAKRLRELGVKSIPTTGLDRNSDFNEAVKKVADRDERGVCIRLLTEDIELAHQLGDKLMDLLGQLGARTADCHVVLDLRSILGANITALQQTVLQCLPRISPLNRWRTVSLVASGLPRTVSEVLGPGDSGYVSRPELELWERARKYAGSDLIYGDYGTVHPDLIYEDSRVLARNMGPNIRYTLNRQWLVIRGHPFQRHPEGFKQYHQMARKLVEGPEFMGPSFSYGDRYVFDKARYVGGPGNPQTWITMSTSHHLALVEAQVKG